MAARQEETGAKEASFEESLAELEAIVEQMESGEPSLADLMENYSRGIRLSQKCMKALERAEKAMDLLVKEKTGETEALELKIEGE
ncbi:MAG: exodeoxyribonuclease VII small subunit [Schwartzia sp.]|nr:exodeoxyribonuclease VII small subunit [Schwartzia sp. (in: firmicutes)]